MRHMPALLLLLILPVARADAVADPELLAALHARVQGFYGWVLHEADATQPLAPAVRVLPGSPQPQLDTATLDGFIARFMASGQFAPEFPRAVEQYYQRSATRIAALPAQELDEISRGEYGPVLETDDMDLFFCAQEYEYTPDFIQQMQLQQVQRNGATASAEVVSAYEWRTQFGFRQVDGQWLISRYCVFQP